MQTSPEDTRMCVLGAGALSCPCGPPGRLGISVWGGKGPLLSWVSGGSILSPQALGAVWGPSRAGRRPWAQLSQKSPTIILGCCIRFRFVNDSSAYKCLKTCALVPKTQPVVARLRPQIQEESYVQPGNSPGTPGFHHTGGPGIPFHIKPV